MRNHQVQVCGYEKAIHSNSCIHIKTDVLHSHKSMKVLFEKELPHYVWENMCRSFIMFWYDRMKEINGFPLKTYLENHKPRVDGNTSACISIHQHAYQYSNWGSRERKHMRSKKTKNSYIGCFHICFKTEVFEDKKPEYYKTCSVPQRKTRNYIPALVKSIVIWFLTSSCRKTHVNV